jgi:hypothetical protein
LPDLKFRGCLSTDTLKYFFSFRLAPYKKSGNFSVCPSQEGLEKNMRKEHIRLASGQAHSALGAVHKIAI